MLARIALAVLLAAGLGLAGCGQKASVRTVVIDKMAFGAAPPELHVGDTVAWVNHDIFKHSATADRGGFDVDIEPGAMGKARMAAAGHLAYHCRYHPGMTGVLTVEP